MTVEAFMAQADADRQQREQAREDFVALLRNGRTSIWLRHAAELLDGQHDPFYRTSAKDALEAFAEAHGWPDTLRAVAAAMDADERERRELMDRR